MIRISVLYNVRHQTICQYGKINYVTPFQQKQTNLIIQMENSFSAGKSVSTVVPMQSDYKHDNQLCLTCVSFLSKNVASTINSQFISPLKSIVPEFYYYQEGSLHITIQNIRIIHNPPHFNQIEINKARQLLTDLIPKIKPFQFELVGLISLPTSIAIIALVRPEYDTFVKMLRHSLVASGIPDDKKYFTDEIIFANITICRYTHKPSQKFMNKVDALKEKSIGPFVANKLSLVEMNAGAHPSKTRILGTYSFLSN